MTGLMSRRQLLTKATVAASAFALGGHTVASPAGARSTDVHVVNTNGSRLRSGPGSSYGVVASLSKGTDVRYLSNGGSANGYTWYKVKVLSTGREGFIASSLLWPLGGSGADPGFPTNVVVTRGPLHVRQYPGLSQPVLGSVQIGAKGWLTQRTSAVVDGYQWFEVTFVIGGRYVTGNVASDFISIS